MNPQRDPPRWKVQACADPTLRRALRAASRERPSKADVSWMESALSARIGVASSGVHEAASHAPAPPGPGFVPAPVVRSSHLSPLLGKLLGVLVVGSATVGGGLWASRSIAPSGPLAAWHDTARPQAQPVPVAAGEGTREETRVVAVSELRFDRASVSPGPAVEPRVQPKRMRERPKARSLAAVVDEPPSSSSDDRALVKPPAEDDGSKPSASEDRSIAQPAPEEAPSVPPVAKELSETEVLMAARRALASDPAAALGWVRQHERSFATPALAEEREVIAIDALRRLNRVTEANARRRRFYARYPSSIHGRSIETPVTSAPTAGTAATSPHAQR